MQDYRFNIQKRTANLFAIGCLLIIILNYIIRIIIMQESITQFLFYYVPVLLIGILSLISKIKFSSKLQLLQISLIFITAVLTILSYTSISNITGETIIIFFIYLSIQYGFLRKKFTLKIILLLIFIIALKITNVFFIKKSYDTSYEAIFLFIAQYILLSFMFSLFAFNQQEELNNYIQQKKIAENKFFKNEVYIELGKAVRDFIHDLKAIGGTWLSLKIVKEVLLKIVKADNPAKIQISETLETLERSIEMLKIVYDKQDTINKIAYAKYKIKPEMINICDIVNHVINYLGYIYYLKDINITQDYPNELLIRAVPFEIVQALENIIKNSIEAMKKTAEKSLTIKIGKEEDNVKIIISDTGGGILFAKNDGIVNLDNFSIGRSTKPEGTGWGVFSSINFITNNNGDIKFYSIKNHGTNVVIKFKIYNGGYEE